MSIYELPDGKKIKIPTDPLKKAELVSYVKANYDGLDLEDTNALTQAGEALKAVPRGLANLALSVPEGIVSLFDIGDDSQTLKGLRAMERSLQEDSILAGDPLYADKFSTKLGEGIGSFLPFLGAGAAGQAIARTSKATPFIKLGMDLRSPTFQFPAALAVPSGMSQAADRVQLSREMGEDVGPIAETLATLTGGLIGLTELLPITKFLKGVPKEALRFKTDREKIFQALKQFTTGAIAEGGQEVGASLMQDLTARGLYSDELPILDSWFDELAVGGVIGGSTNVILKSMIGKKRSITDPYFLDMEGKHRKNVDGIYSRRKEYFKQLSKQGDVEIFEPQENVVKPELKLPDEIGLSPNIEISRDADGKFSLIDLNENKRLSTFDTEAKAIAEKSKKLNEYDQSLIDYKVENDLYNLGLIESSTGKVIGVTTQDSNVTTVPLQLLINYDANLSSARKKQIEEQSKIEQEITKNSKDLLSRNRTKTAEAIKKENEKLRKRIMKLDPLVSKRANLDNASKYLKTKGLPLKESYTLEEAKQALSTQDFNQLLKERADIVFKKSGSLLNDGKPKPNTSNQYIKEVAAMKNIELNFNDPAVKYAAKQWTGIENISNTKLEGARRLFLARLDALPPFTKSLPFPDFRNRDYTAKDTDKFVANVRDDGSSFSLKDVKKFGQDQKFIDDLIYSGRAEKLAKANEYRLVNNFEFEINRRSEGFGETPTEYRERLEAEGKLTPEVIDELVSQEETKQAKLLPPSDMERQKINYNEAIQEGKTNKFAKEAKKILSKAGLKETGLVVSNDIISPEFMKVKDDKLVLDKSLIENREGAYDRANDVIYISLNTVNPEGNASDVEIQNAINKIVDHEMIHALRAKDLITEKEYNYLRNQVKKRKVPASFSSKHAGKTFYQMSKDVNSNTFESNKNLYEEAKEEAYVEEAIAELYRARNVGPDVPPKAETIFQKIIQFFKSMGQAMRNSGYNKASELFSDIESGVIGGRKRGVIRTLREIDKTQSGFGGITAEQKYVDAPAFSTKESDNFSLDSLRQRAYFLERQLMTESMNPNTRMKLENELYSIRQTLENEGITTIPLFSTRTGRKHGVSREYTVDSDGEVRGKSAVVKVMTDKNADQVIEDLQGLSDRHPSPLDSEEAWLAFERDLVGDNETFIPPSNLIALVNDLDSWKKLHKGKLNKKQLQNVDLGFRGVEEMRKIYADGTATPETTAKLMAWGMLSRKATASNQESAFIDATNDPRLNEFIARALEKEFTDVDVNEYLAWSKTVMPEGSFGKSVTNNLNDFGKIFLKKASKKQSNGASKLQAIHDLFANQELSSAEIRREYYKIIQNSGINNKVLSFNLLMSGRNDVVVLDRIQINNMWDGKNKYQKNIYDDVANQLNNIHGLARYEAMEKALLNKIDSLYEAIGRPQDSSVGRYHWESWVRSSNQEVEHPSIQGIYREALEGMDVKPYADLGVPEGRYDFYNYGATYARDANGNAYVTYPKSNGDLATFTLDSYNEFINLVKKPTTGVVPQGFLVSKVKQGFPWYESEGVNRERLDQLTEAYEKGTTSTREVLQDNGQSIDPNVARRRKSPERREQERELKEITDEVAPQPTKKSVRTFVRKNRDASKGNSSRAKAIRKAVKEVEEKVKKTPRGNIPHYNLNASDVALEAAENFNKDITALTQDPPKFSTSRAVPSYAEESMNRLGRSEEPKSQYETFRDVISNPTENIRAMVKKFRAQIVDNYTAPEYTFKDSKEPEWYFGIDKTTGKKRVNPKTRLPWTEQEAEEQSRKFRLKENDILTRTMAHLRLADKARGIYQPMLTMGYITDTVIDKEGNESDSITTTRPMKLVDHNGKETGEVGGATHFFAPLYQRTDVDMIDMFRHYAVAMRPPKIDVKTGLPIKTPVTEQDIKVAKQLGKDYPEIVAVYNNYQKWNGYIVKWAVRRGILSQEQAEEWLENSHYYPYYRDMSITEAEADKMSITGTSIGTSMIPNNPLDIEIKGSDKKITMNPIEAITRNSLAIVTAGLKNQGTSMLLKDLETMGLAESMGVTRNKKFFNDGSRVPKGVQYVSAYENGVKYFWVVKDRELFESISSVGGTSTSQLAKWAGMPASFLRDTVTRDPGFIVVNILRDTLSSAVTSGAMYGKGMGGIDEGYLPVIDSFKNMFGDLKELEKFGIIGGYDYTNEEGSVRQFVERTMRRQGLTKQGAMKPEDAFYKLWDGLGSLTTKSDGATRNAVYNAVYKHMKNNGATEGQAQSEAAYQALEIINFGRRGLSPIFKTITAAIPFFNARIQGLDVLYRSFTGQYSAIDKLKEGETPEQLRGRIARGAILRGLSLAVLTAMYYMMVSDTDEYRGARREVRDDYWLIPTGTEFPIKIPIPFEVGAIFKVLPERLMDMTLGEDAFTRKSVDEAQKSLGRQLETSLSIPFFQSGFGIQAVKPFFEVWSNRNSFTDSEIIPYYKQKLDPRAQSTERTNEIARILGETFNISPMKIDYVMRGYAGTLGGYLLSMADTGARMITGTPILPNNVELSRLPLVRRLTFDSKKAGGLQQQFYELRGEVDTVVQTINKLREDGRTEEAIAYRNSMQGVVNVKGQVRAMERYMKNWRDKKSRLLKRDDISVTLKSELLRDMEIERDRRLAIIPELRKKANIPIATFGL